jgi:hypothetical protein
MRDPRRREREPGQPPALRRGALASHLVYVYWGPRALGLPASLILSSTASWTWHLMLFNATGRLTI